MSYKRKTKIDIKIPDVSDQDISKLLTEIKDFHGHPLFPIIVDELKDLHSRKNHQYANKERPLGNFERCGVLISKMLKPGINPTLAACLILMAKQIDAVYDIVGENKEGTVESVYDKLKDISIYSVIAMIIFVESEKNKQGLTCELNK